MSLSSPNTRNILAGITSTGSRFDPADHEVNLQALLSHDVALEDVGGTLTTDQKLFILKRMNMDGLIDLDKLPPLVTFLIEKMQQLSEEEAVDILKEFINDFKDDVNILDPDYDLAERLVKQAPYKLGVQSKVEQILDDNEKNNLGHLSVVEIPSVEDSDEDDDIRLFYHNITDWNLQVKVEAGLIAYHSPYTEVRSVTDPYDDPSIACETPRVYVVGVIWTAIGTVINQFFSERYPSIGFGSLIAQVFIYPSGVLLSMILPHWKFTIWNNTIDMNPGPWTSKEQMLATLFYTISGGSPYVALNILVQKLPLFYDNQWATFGYQVLLTLCTQFLGFGLAGVMRRFVVYPVQAVWPSLLPTIALNKTLTTSEPRENINGWIISKYSFFFLTFGASFLYFWFPNYIAQFLSTFNWMTWIKPDNYNLAVITGSVHGLGLNPVPSLDWNVLDSVGALATPFYSVVNQAIGWFLGFFCIVAVFYSNNHWSEYLPINSNKIFTNKGTRYNVGAILNEKGLFDQEKYNNYGPPYYSAANLVTYGAFFALYPFAFVYELATNWRGNLFAVKSLIHTMRNFHRSNYDGYNDPFSRLMLRYKEVPDWVFLIVLVVSLVLGILCVKLYPAETPVWGIFFAIAINFVFLIPICSLASRTSFSFGLNVLVELIVGYAIPGNGLALMLIKALGYNIDAQAENYITNQKIAHYTSIPPWALFRVQMLSIILNAFVFLGILSFQLTGIKDYCEPFNKEKFTCPGSYTFFSSSVIWGVIGPKKVFDGLYPILKYCFLIGFLLTIPAIAFKWYGPKKFTRYFQPTLMIGGFLIYAPYNLSYYIGGLYLSAIFMWYLRTRKTAWWEKYNYIFATGMGAGIAFSGIIIFFAVQYHAKNIHWWGNTVMYAGYDGVAIGRLNATLSAPDGYFGPRKGHFP